MKKTLLILCVLCVSFAQAQLSLPFTEDFEGKTLDAPTAPDDYVQELTTGATGTSTYITGVNGTQVASSSALTYDPDGVKNHYFRTPALSCTAGNSYTTVIDVASSSKKVNFRVITSTDGGVFDAMEVDDVAMTASIGTVNDVKDQTDMPKNTPNTVTLNFDVPAGATQLRIQMYVFGVNSLQIDNISITDDNVLSVGGVEANAVKLQSNLIDDSLTFISNKTISEVIAVNLTGGQTVLSSNDGKTFSTSSLNAGVYILKASLSNGATQSFQVIKQ